MRGPNMAKPRGRRGGVGLLGRGHLKGSQHLTFNDLTVHNYNILNTTQHFQLVAVPSAQKNWRAIFLFCSYIIGGPYWGGGGYGHLVLTPMSTSNYLHKTSLCYTDICFKYFLSIILLSDYYCDPDRGAEYCDDYTCLSVSSLAYLRSYTSDLRQFFTPVAVAGSFSGGVAIRYVTYVFPVL